MYAIEFTQLANKQLHDLDANSRERIEGVLERIKFNPYHYVQRLVGDTAYRLRVGDYRVIIDIKETKLLILVIRLGHRKNIYN